MFELIENEFTKIFKRKNIYVLLIIGLLVIFTYNFFISLMNLDTNVPEQYKRALANDLLRLEYYNELSAEEKYEDIFERVLLEKYATENNIQYNILLDNQNSSAPIPQDARSMFIKIFKNFNIVNVFIIVYISSTIVSEEVTNGTIKKLLTKPYSRFKIIFSKLITCICVMIMTVSFVLLTQYVLRKSFLWK